MVYKLKLRDECGDRTEVCVEADSIDEALDMAEDETKDWVRSGDWGINGALVKAWFELEDEGAIHEGSVVVEIEPDARALIRRASGEVGLPDTGCGDDHDDHEWVGIGGCDQNPGVYSKGGRSIGYRGSCSRCGLNINEFKNNDGVSPKEVRYWWDDTPLTHIAAVLRANGDAFAGLNSLQTADDWVSEEFTDPDEVNAWCEVGVWAPEVAAAFRDEGISPSVAREAADVMVARDGKDTFTDGDPIYAACNGDLDVSEIIEVAKEYHG